MEIKALNNPKDFHFCRELEDNHSTSPNLFIRNCLFQVIEKGKRKSLTKIDKNGIERDIHIEKSYPNQNSSLFFYVNGPLLCQYDQEIFYALIKIWHEKKSKGGEFETNITQIVQTLGLQKNISYHQKKSILKALERMTAVILQVKKSNGELLWGNNVLGVINSNDNENTKIKVQFNNDFLKVYLNSEYSTFDFNLWLELSTYAKKMYTYFISHKPTENINRISVEKMMTIIDFKGDIKKRHIKYKFKKVVNELKDKNIFEEETYINKNGHLIYKIPSKLYLREMYRNKNKKNSTGIIKIEEISTSNTINSNDKIKSHDNSHSVFG